MNKLKMIGKILLILLIIAAVVILKATVRIGEDITWITGCTKFITRVMVAIMIFLAE